MAISSLIYHSVNMLILWLLTAVGIFTFLGLDDDGWAPLVPLALAIIFAAFSIIQWFI